MRVRARLIAPNAVARVEGPAATRANGSTGAEPQTGVVTANGQARTIAIVACGQPRDLKVAEDDAKHLHAKGVLKEGRGVPAEVRRQDTG